MRTFSTSIVALVLSSLAMAAPVLEKRSLLENQPWYLSNIVVFDAASGSKSSSSIEFRIRDTNEGLEFDTACHRKLDPGTTGTVVDPNSWYRCDNHAVSYKYTGDQIHISRRYKDSEVGPAGMDIVTCFGNWQTSLHEFAKSDGITRSQGCMEIYCTMVIA